MRIQIHGFFEMCVCIYIVTDSYTSLHIHIQIENTHKYKQYVCDCLCMSTNALMHPPDRLHLLYRPLSIRLHVVKGLSKQSAVGLISEHSPTSQNWIITWYIHLFFWSGLWVSSSHDKDLDIHGRFFMVFHGCSSLCMIYPSLSESPSVLISGPRKMGPMFHGVGLARSLGSLGSKEMWSLEACSHRDASENGSASKLKATNSTKS